MLDEDAARHLDTVEQWEPQVDQDQIGAMLAGKIHGFDAVACVRADVEAGLLEDETQVGANDRIVLDREDPSWGRALRRRSRPEG